MSKLELSELSEPVKSAGITISALPDESVRAYQAFVEYVQMGDGRSLEALYKANKNLSRWVAVWSRKYHWQARLKDYQVALQAERLTIWQQRQEIVRQADYAQADQLRELADKILAAAPRFIKSTVRVETMPDGTRREVHTVALDGRLMIDAAQTASKLQRQATGLDTPGKLQISIEYTQLVTALNARGISPSDLFEALLEELAESDKGIKPC